MKKFQRLVCSYLIVTMTMNPLLTTYRLMRALGTVLVPSSLFINSVNAIADELKDAGNKGQRTGKSIIKNFTLPTVNPTTGQMDMNIQGSPISLQREDVFPGASSEAATPANLYGQDIEITQQAGQKSQNYLDPANTDPTANAYKLLRDRDLVSRPRLTQGDPIAVKANDIYSDRNGDLSAILQACTSNTTTTGETFINYGSPKIETCDRLTIADDKCEVKHELQLETMLTGMSLYVADNNDSGWSAAPWGTCTLDFKNGTSSCVPHTITQCGGGYMGVPYTCTQVARGNIWFSMSIVNTMPFAEMCQADSSYITIRTTGPSNKVLSQSPQPWITYNGNGFGYLDIIQEPSCANGMVGKYQFRTVCGEDPCVSGPPAMTITNTIARIVKDEWYVAPSCASTFNAIDDGTICQGSVTCENDDANGCVMTAGILNCPTGKIGTRMKPTPPELVKYNIPKTCTDIKVETTCNTCLSDTYCDPSNAPTQNCTQYTSEAACGIIRQDCLDGFSNPDGTGCYAYQETYDCDPDKNRNPQYKNCTETYGTGTGTKVICDKDANGIEHCQTHNLAVATDSCAPYKNNEQCRLVYEDSVSALKDNNEEPVGKQSTYDCGFPLPGQMKSTTEATCNGATIRCMGTDCMDVATETNKDFGQVVAMSQIVNFSQQDSNCGTDGNCIFFKGEFFNCKSGFFGIVDCCSSPKGVSPFDYLELITNTWALSQRTELGQELAAKGKDVAGSLLDMSQGTALLDDVLSPMTSAFDQISSTIGGSILQPGTNWLNISPDISTGMYNFVSSAFGDDVALQIFDPIYNGTELTGQFGMNVSNFMSFMQPLMTIYMYYQIAVLIIQIIWSCEEEEFTLGAKKAQRLCHYNGTFCGDKILGVCVIKKKSYCCFNSPFARIMQEQIRPQLGKPWGSAKHPDCSGITIAQLSSVDFSKVDLGEWISLLQVGGIQDTSIANATQKLSLENMTKYSDKAASNKDSIYDRVEKGVGQVDLIQIKDSVTP
ncbi:MAG: conjugal transfer protein TraN [Methylophilus sp.]|uniref:conjugal transfer protein TraN n=1 Tax=Methylophilus sp. TaxID=29541 RepID=UPI003FA0D71F